MAPDEKRKSRTAALALLHRFIRCPFIFGVHTLHVQQPVALLPQPVLFPEEVSRFESGLNMFCWALQGLTK